MESSLAGRVAVVTGSGTGIGRAYAKRFAREGAAVVVADIDLEAAERVADGIREAGGRAIAVKLDQRSAESCEAMAAVAADTFGGIDVLVNNAALFGVLTRKPVWDIKPEEWDEVLAVNLKGPFLCSLAVLPYLRRRGAGKIINISSSSIYAAKNRLGHYVAAKMGLVGLTRVLARELGQFGIQVNAVAPGITESGAAVSPHEFIQAAVGERSNGRVQKPEDLEDTIVFLSSAGSDFITGQTIVVDGGVVFS